MGLLDQQSLQLVGAFVLGQLSALMLVFVQHWLEGKRNVSAENRSRSQRVIEEAYGPTTELLNRMIDSYPDVEKLRENLRNIFLERASMFEPRDREQIWIALWDASTDLDLIQVRDRLQHSEDVIAQRISR